MTKLAERDVRESLRKSSLQPEHVENVVSAMRRSGLIESSGAMFAGEVSAAAPRVRTLDEISNVDPIHARMAARVVGEARSLGVQLDTSKIIDGHELSAALKANNVDVPTRMRLKSALHQCGALS